jgi:hypothetical protein
MLESVLAGVNNRGSESVCAVWLTYAEDPKAYVPYGVEAAASVYICIYIHTHIYSVYICIYMHICCTKWLKTTEDTNAYADVCWPKQRIRTRMCRMVWRRQQLASSGQAVSSTTPAPSFFSSNSLEVVISISHSIPWTDVRCFSTRKIDVSEPARLDRGFSVPQRRSAGFNTFFFCFDTQVAIQKIQR